MKRAIIAVALVLAAACGWAQQQTAGEYKVGDIGPAGGWIFYDTGQVTDGWCYLETAPVEAEFTAEWGPRKFGSGCADLLAKQG
jgi:hypothetical protein